MALPIRWDVMGPSTAYGPQLPIDGCCSPEFASELERWRRFRGGERPPALCNVDTRHAPAPAVRARTWIRGRRSAARSVPQRESASDSNTGDQVVDADVYPGYAEAFRWYLRPQPDKFRTRSKFRNGNLAR